MDHAATMRRMYDLINAGDVEGFGARLADDFVEHEELPGLDPGKASIFIQSLVPQIAELTVFFSMFVTVSRLRHNPTIKTEAGTYGYTDMTYGFLGYPVSQAADILFLRADLVPVGEDQLPHIEMTRFVARRKWDASALRSNALKPSRATR